MKAFLQEQECNSLLEYIARAMEDNVSDIVFPNLDCFEELLKLGILKPGKVIRTSDRGVIDEHYLITPEGKLEGITNCSYPGEKGVHEPKNILSGKRISDGWSIGSFGLVSVVEEAIKRKKEKNGPEGI